MENKIMKIREIIERLESDPSICFQPENPDINVLGTGCCGQVKYFDGYGNSRQVEEDEMEQELPGRFLEVE